MKLNAGTNSEEVIDFVEGSGSLRKTYSTPKLTRFGKVSQLTQSASGCNMADNPDCTVEPGSNMGPTMSMG